MSTASWRRSGGCSSRAATMTTLAPLSNALASPSAAARKTIDLNCDMGESYGRWTLGADEAIMPLISSANVAWGFHGGDPHVMRKTVELALAHGVALGAHPSLPDLMGFGRRTMDVIPRALRDYFVYQTGALRELARAAGAALQHMKPHGILYGMME